MAQLVKNLPTMQQTRIQSLGQEDPPEKGMATHSTVLAWRILWREEPGELITVHGVSKSQTQLTNTSSENAFRKVQKTFELCWGRLLRAPWTARRSNQLILKEINPEYSLEGLMLKLKLQYLGHLTLRANSLEKPLMLGTIEGRRRRG